MKLKVRRTPFKTDEAERAYRAHIHDGPLARIFASEELRLAPAKGARKYREDAQSYPNLYDQTYFAHALNVSTTAGLLFEMATEEHTVPGGLATEREMRVVLAAGALHDFNKLPPAGGRSLARSLDECRDEAKKLVEGFVEPHDFETVVHLALDTEDTTSKESSSYELTLSARRATLAAWCLQLADRLVGSGANPDNPEKYLETVRKFKAKHDFLPEIHVQPFVLVPQSLLAREARNAFIEWIRAHGTLLHESERYVTWVGPEPDEEDLKTLSSNLWDRVKPEPAAAFDKAGYSHNSFGTTWTRFYDPSPEVVDKWIEHFGGKLVFWQGDWGIKNFDSLNREFPGVFAYDPPTNSRPRGRVRVEVPEKDEAAGPEYHQRRAVAKLVVAHCVLQTLLDAGERGPPAGDTGPFDAKEPPEGVMGSTVAGILWARTERGNAEAAYNALLTRIGERLRETAQPTENPLAGFFFRLLGKGVTPPAGATGEGCSYCASTEDAVPIEKANVFGINPTAWAPRKKGVQRESHKGYICALCVVENQLRDMAARQFGAATFDNGFLSAHIHAADLVCDVFWDGLTPLLNSDAVNPTVEGDPTGRTLKLFPKGERFEKAGGQNVPLRGHYSIPIPKPGASGKVSETLAHLFRLRDCLTFIRKTGFKLHVSPLALVPAQQKAQFRWENSPSWMAALGLAEVHVDEILPYDENRVRRPGALEVVEALIRGGYEMGGNQGHRTFISRLIQTPLSVYEAAGTKVQPINVENNFVEILEARYVDRTERTCLEKIAIAYIKFNARGEWTNNTWTWATRHFLELRDRYFGEPEWRDLVVGDLLAYAQRQNPATTVGQIEAFVDEMEEYLTRFRGGQPPIGSDRRVLINAIAYQCKKQYRNVFPKEVSV